MKSQIKPFQRRLLGLGAPALCLLLAAIAPSAWAQYKVASLANSYSNVYGSVASASYNYPNGGAALVLGLSDNPAAGASGTVDGSTDLVGDLRSSWDRSSIFEVPDLPRRANAYGAADLASATLGASAYANSVVASAYGVSGHGYAAFSDTLRWSVAGADHNTVTLIGVRFSLNGLWSKDDPRQSAGSMDWFLAFGGGTVIDSANWLGFDPVETVQQQANGWVSSAFVRNVQTDSITDLVFEGTYALQGASGVLTVGSYLDTFVSGGTIDFSHTGLFSFTALPGTLSMGSDSGVFPIRVVAVPEPQTYALLVAGLGVLGWMARRRRAA